jgi:SSS family solute:Na+ symporter
MGTVAPRSTPWKIETTNNIDMTPWKGAKVASGILVVIVIGIYAYFA